MDRSSFHKLFKTTGPVVLPVVHVLTEQQALTNIRIAMREGAQGVFLINHDFSKDQLLPILIKIRSVCPYLWMGVNFLGVSAKKGFSVLGDLTKQGCEIDGYWVDNAEINEKVPASEQQRANEIDTARKASGWKGLYFGGTAFKYQRHVDNDMLNRAAEIACNFMEVVTTSGPGTGQHAPIERIAEMRKGVGNKTLAVASGVTPDNAHDYASHVDCFLVATGVSSDFHHLDPALVRALVMKTRGNYPITLSPVIKNENAWYLSLLLPHTLDIRSIDSEVKADLSALYADPKAFSNIISDFTEIIQCDIPEVDLIAAVSTSGAPLGAGIASKLGKGFVHVDLTTLKDDQVADTAGESTSHPASDQQPPPVQSQIRSSVIIIDVCIEDDVAVKAGIKFVQSNGGNVVALAAVCIKENELTTRLCQEYYSFDIVPSHMKKVFNEFVKFK